MIVSFLRPLVPVKTGKESSSDDSGLDPRFRGDDNSCMLSSLEQSILSTFVYFDIFDYPLTLLELHRWLYKSEREYTVNEVREALSSPSLTRVLSSQHGFFYLAGREQIIRERHRRYCLSVGKLRRARRITRFLAAVPFVRTIAVSGSLAYRNARLDSDIDLLILTKRGGVWWARFIAVACLHLLRLRPGQGGKADKICLSVFADEDNFDFQRLLFSGDDIDFVFWLANIVPLYGRDYYLRFWQANEWMRAYLPNAVLAHVIASPVPHFAGRGEAIPAQSALLVSRPSWTINKRFYIRPILEAVLTPFTGAIRRLQQALFPPAIRALMNQDTRVRVEDGLLKFHTTDRRRQYAAEFARRYRQF